MSSRRLFFTLFFCTVASFITLFSPIISRPSDSMKSEITLSPEANVSLLAPYLFFFEDPSKKMDIEKISALEFQKNFYANLKKQTTPYWVTKSAVWGKINIDLTDQPGNFYLYFDNDVIEQIDFYFPLENGQYQKIASGHKIPVFERIISDRKIIVPLRSNVFSQVNFSHGTIYFRMESYHSEVNLNSKLVNDAGLNHEQIVDAALLSAYFGIILAMALYNFFIYTSLRNKNYLLYVLYILSFAYCMAQTHGLTRDLFLFNYLFDIWLVNIIVVQTLMIGNFFVISFLELKKNLSGTYRILTFFNIILPFVFFIRLFDPILYSQIFFVLLAANVTISFSAGIRLYRKFVYARDFTYAWSFILVSNFLYALVVSGIYIPYVTIDILYQAHIIETVLLAIALARRIKFLQQEQDRFTLLQRDLGFARDIQTYLFPGNIPKSEHYSLEGRYLPSGSLSGDFYDFILEDDHKLYFLMVDVAGHGYSAGLVAAMINIAFHETRSKTKNVREHQTEINRILHDNVQNIFATAINLRIDPEEKKFQMARAGHVPMLHYKRATGELAEYAPKGAPLGILEEYYCEEITLKYTSGDRLILFTDGILEELNASNEEFGMARFKNIIIEHAAKNSSEFCDFIQKEISFWIDKRIQDDDITFFIIDLH